jgi:hypothetical protein
MSTMIYSSGYPELYGSLQSLALMPIDQWLDSFGQVIRFLVDTRQ